MVTPFRFIKICSNVKWIIFCSRTQQRTIMLQHPSSQEWKSERFGVTWENMFTVRIMDLHSVLTIKPRNGSFFPTRQFFVAYAIFICSSPCFITVRMDTAYHIMTTVILSWNTLPRFFVEIFLRHGMDRYLIVPYFIRHGWWQICTFPVLSHHF